MSKLAVLVATGLVATCVSARPTTEQNIKRKLEPRLAKGVKIDSVRRTGVGRMYEVRAGGEILYTDRTGTYIFLGQLINAKTGRNLTKERLEVINKITFSQLPLQHALKMVKGNGKRVIAIFEDPNCGYCKQFRKTTLKEIDNVTVYTFMLNILSEDSTIKSTNIWCAPDRNKAWDDWMLENKAAAPAPAGCTTPHDAVFALAQKYAINGTPAIFFTDGSRFAGAVDTKTLEAKLAQVK